MGGLTLRGHIGISARICHWNRNPLQSDASMIVYRNGALTLLAAMTDLDRREEQRTRRCFAALLSMH
jgi:hypothetical protein